MMITDQTAFRRGLAVQPLLYPNVPGLCHLMVAGQQLAMRLRTAVRMRNAFNLALENDSGSGDTLMVYGVEYWRDEAEAAIMALEAEIGAQPDDERAEAGLSPMARCTRSACQ